FLAWLVPFVLIGLSQNQRTRYLLPTFPAAALLIAWWADRHGAGRARGIPIVAAVGGVGGPAGRGITEGARGRRRHGDHGGPLVRARRWHGGSPWPVVEGRAARRRRRRSDRSSVLGVAGATTAPAGSRGGSGDRGAALARGLGAA